MNAIGKDHRDELQAMMLVVSQVYFLLVEVRVLVAVPAARPSGNLELTVTEGDDVVVAAALRCEDSSKILELVLPGEEVRQTRRP
eukprot:33523-Rhodomonas_salina.1